METDNITERVKAEAKALGACNLYKQAKNVKGLADLFFSPQGREFCIKHDFPSVYMWRQLKAEHITNYGVFCDVGHFESVGGKMYGLIGKTTAELKFDTINNYLVILQHGAKATIKASNYAVVKIEKGEGCEVVTINEDGTAVFM